MGKKLDSRWGTVFCATDVLILLVLLEPLFQEYAHKPAINDFNSLNGFILANNLHGDYVLFQPQWLRGFARDLGRLQFIPDYSDNIFTQGLAGRIWLVSLDEAEPKTKLTIRLVNTTEIGRLNVRLYEVTKKPATLKDMLANSKARIGATGGVLDGDKIVFEGLPDWTNIVPTTKYFHGDGHNGLFFHPISNKRKILEFYNIPAGSFYFTYGLKPRLDCNPTGIVNLTLTVNDDVAFSDSMALKTGGVRNRLVELLKRSNHLVVEATTVNDTCMHFFINGYIQP